MTAKQKIDKSKFADRNKLLLEKYGITEDQWDKIYDTQAGKCPICQTKLFRYHEKPGRRAAPVDHDHKTGRVRGILCYSCNRWRVGRNTLDHAKAIVKYLGSKFDGREI